MGNIGIGFLGLMALMFIGFKVAHVIDWSWWFVLMPLWGPFVILAAITLLLAFVQGCYDAWEGIKDAVRESRK